jgi:hypothetical protein
LQLFSPVQDLTAPRASRGTSAAYPPSMPTTSSKLLQALPLLTFLAAAPAFATGCIAEADDGTGAEDLGETAIVEEETDTNQGDLAGKTVLEAAGASCSTTSVKGLSLQIIAEARCLNPNAYVEVPALSNVSFGSATFRFLEKPARDKLVAALKAKPGTTMTINSMLRTVAQQYLLYRWYQTGRCSISLAAKPGSSNHETGLALDVSQYSTWKTTLQNNGFHWLGSSDAVHFDYAGSGAVSHKGLDVKAFQRLWNRNHPGDTIATDGVWGPQTEARMKKSPSDGFAKGAQCAAAYIIDGEGMVEDESLRSDSYNEPSAADALELDPNTMDMELIEELEAAHEEESCSDHAH